MVENFIIRAATSIEEVDLEALHKLQHSSEFSPGEVVVVAYGYTRPKYEAHTIKSVSKTGQVLLKNGWRFLPDGRMIGENTGLYRLRKATPQLLEMSSHQLYTSYLSGVNWGLLDNDVQRRILDILEPILRGVPRE